jgi:hypothetical protein
MESEKLVGGLALIAAASCAAPQITVEEKVEAPVQQVQEEAKPAEETPKAAVRMEDEGVQEWTYFETRTRQLKDISKECHELVKELKTYFKKQGDKPV